MPARRAETVNAFETTLAAAVTPTDGSALLTSISGLEFPTYLVLDPTTPGKREIVWATGATGTTVTLAERYLEGSSLPSGITHDAGSLVRAAVAAQFIEDLHDRIDVIGLGHDAYTDDDHTNLLNNARHDTQARHQPGTIGTAIAGPSLPGDSNAEGVNTTFSRSDHRHSREQHGSAQHAVGTVVPAGTPGSSAPGDAPSAGVATTAARSDHVHGREAAAAFVGARVHSSAATIPENVYTAIPWSTEVFDSNGFWTSGAATRFTIPAGQAGKYLVNGQVLLSASTGATVAVRIRKNATTTMAEAQVPNDPNTSPACAVTSILDLAVGDFITLDVTHDFVGTDRTVVGGAATPLSFFELVRLGT